jgi:hypothetical protein
MSDKCTPDNIKLAMFEQANHITTKIDERIKTSMNTVLRLIPDGGVVPRDANNGVVIMSEAYQASVAYNTADHSQRPLEAPGYSHTDDFKARTQAGTTGLFNNFSNQFDTIGGRYTLESSQGYRIRKPEDKYLFVDTRVYDARDLARLGLNHVKAVFEFEQRNLTQWSMRNFEDNLRNLVIEHGEANAAIIDKDQFNVTKGGWQAPPVKRLSIHFLQEYSDYIKAEMRGKGMMVPDGWMFTIEAPVEDWIEAVIADKKARDITGTQYANEQFSDTEGPLRGRKFGVYGNIKCYFTETPLRGYFKKVSTVGGKDNFEFVQVYDTINVKGENGGTVAVTNHDYRKSSIVVDGVRYDMCTLIPHIDPRSFKRFGLVKPVKPVGEANMGVNMQIKFIDGAYIPFNEDNNKGKWITNHEFRFLSVYPELSGYIAYRSSERPSYHVDVTTINYASGPDTPATHEQFQTTGVDDRMDAECAQCDKVSEQDGSCVEPGAEAASVLALSPAGAVTTISRGANYSVKLLVRRTGGVAACSVNYATANGTAAAGSDYTATSGVLTWAAGDTAPKEITVPMLAAATDGQTLTVTISGEVGATILTGASQATLTIDVI